MSKWGLCSELSRKAEGHRGTLHERVGLEYPMPFDATLMISYLTFSECVAKIVARRGKGVP
jgi:hypothetical protein